MSEPRHILSVDNGKYKFINRNGFTIDIARYDEPWVLDVNGPKAIASMMAALDAARVVLEAARKTVDGSCEGLASIGALRDAIEKHDRLVDDRTPPSEWCR